MSYYYSNPGGFSISKTVLPSVTSSICQSAGLNSGGVVRENATVSTSSTAVLPYMQETITTTTTRVTTNRVPVSGYVNNSVSFNYNNYFYDTPTYQIIDPKGGTGFAFNINYTNYPADPKSYNIINSFTVTNNGSGYTSPPIINIYGAVGDPSYPLTTTITFNNFQDNIITSTSSSTSLLHPGSFQQVVDNDPKLILLK